MHSLTGFGLLAHPGVQRPGTLPMRHPSPIGHRSSYTSAEFAGRFRAVRPTPALPEADPLRYAEAEIAVFAGFPSSTHSRRSTSLNRRQSRRSSPTKINKEVISKADTKWSR